MFRPLLILTLLFSSLAVALWIYPLTKKTPYEEATDAFIEQKYQQARSSLTNLPSNFSKAEYSLLQAYIARETEGLLSSDEWLKQAMTEAQTPKIQLEIRINQALNAFLNRDLDKLRAATQNITALNPDQPWAHFFDGWIAYNQKDWKTANEKWGSLNTLPYFSRWMRPVFSQNFDEDWISLHLIAVKIAQGNALEARRELTRKPPSPFANDLLARTYEIEAETHSGPASIPFYRMALTYLKKIPENSPIYQQHIAEITPKIQALSLLLLSDSKFSNTSSSHLAFLIRTLNQWSAKNEINTIQTSVQEALLEALEEERFNDLSSITSILKEFPNPPYKLLLSSMLQTVSTQISKENFSQALEIWKICKRDFGEIGIPVLPTLSTDSLLPHILANNDAAFSLWLTTDPSQEESILLANKIKKKAVHLWALENQIEQSEKLLAYLEQLNLESQHLQEAIAEIIFASTKKKNWAALPKLYAIAKKADLERLFNLPKKEIAAILLQKNPAIDQLRWVYFLHPENQEIIQKLAELEFEFEYYPQALALFNKLPSLTDQQKLNQHIAKLLTGADEPTQNLSKDSLLRVAIGFERIGRDDQSLFYLDQIPKSDPDALIIRAYIYTQKQQWKKSLETLAELSPKLQKSTPAEVLTFFAQSRLHQTKHDIELEKPWKSSPLFQRFLNRTIAPWNKKTLQAYYLLYGEENPEKAIEHLQKIPSLKPPVRLLLGHAFEKNEQFQNAIETLTPLAKDSSLSISLQKELAPFLGYAFLKIDRNYDAYLWYKHYFSLPNSNSKYKRFFAQALSKVHLWESSLEQYLSSASKSIEVRLEMIQALIHTNSWEKATKKAQALATEKTLNNGEKITLARSLLVLNMPKEAETLIQTLPAASILSVKELTDLVYYLLETANYPVLLELTKSEKERLIKNSGGLVALVEMNLQLSRKKEALGLIEEAMDLNPNSPEVLEFLLKRPPNFSLIDKLIKTLDHDLSKDPNSLSLKIAYVTAMIQWTAATQAELRLKKPFALVEKQELLFLSDELIRNYPQFPILKYLRGRIHLLIGDYKKAAVDFSAALAIDPSYALAAIDGARTYLQLKQVRKAHKMIKKAIRFYPFDSNAWTILATLQRSKGRSEEAAEDYQQAIRYAPGYLNNYFELAMLYLKLKNPESAVTVLKAAASIAPHIPEVHALLLKALYDPLLFVEDTALLQEERTKTFSQLKQIAPKVAEQIQKDLEIQKLQ